MVIEFTKNERLHKIYGFYFVLGIDCGRSLLSSCSTKWLSTSRWRSPSKNICCAHLKYVHNCICRILYTFKTNCMIFFGHPVFSLLQYFIKKRFEMKAEKDEVCCKRVLGYTGTKMKQNFNFTHPWNLLWFQSRYSKNSSLFTFVALVHCRIMEFSFLIMCSLDFTGVLFLSVFNSSVFYFYLWIQSVD